jgi:hypothetical protein
MFGCSSRRIDARSVEAVTEAVVACHEQAGLATISMIELQRVKVIESVVDGRLTERQISGMKHRFEADRHKKTHGDDGNKPAKVYRTKFIHFPYKTSYSLPRI